MPPYPTQLFRRNRWVCRSDLENRPGSGFSPSCLIGCLERDLVITSLFSADAPPTFPGRSDCPRPKGPLRLHPASTQARKLISSSALSNFPNFQFDKPPAVQHINYGECFPLERRRHVCKKGATNKKAVAKGVAVRCQGRFLCSCSVTVGTLTHRPST